MIPLSAEQNVLPFTRNSSQLLFVFLPSALKDAQRVFFLFKSGGKLDQIMDFIFVSYMFLQFLQCA